VAARGRFHIPLYIDHRGRCYGQPLFNFHGPDYVRGVFYFANGKAIGAEGLLQLKAYVAGLADGLVGDKPSRLNFDERLTWIERNMTRISEVGQAVARGDYPTLPDTLKDQVQFIAASYELWRALDVGPGFITHLPLSFDASNSAFQHLSAMTRSPDGRYANLGATDVREDLYERVADRANAIFTDRHFVKFKTQNKLGDEQFSIATFANQIEAARFAKSTARCGRVAFPKKGRGSFCWSYSPELTVDVIQTGHIDVTITRDYTKRPTVSYCYGATLQSMTPHIAEVLKGQGKPRAGAPVIAKVINKAIGEVAPSVKQVRRFLKRLARVCAENGILLRWRTPLGMPVLNLADEPDVKTISIQKHGKRRRTNITVGDSGKIDKDAAVRSAPANFTHSLDSTHLMMIADAIADEQIDMVAVHDSFGFLAPDAARSKEIIAQMFVNLYQCHAVLYYVWRQAYDDLPPGTELPEPPWLPWPPSSTKVKPNPRRDAAALRRRDDELNIEDVLKNPWAFI
jgi:DNA-directed RNA polymerase, mitochondrial